MTGQQNPAASAEQLLGLLGTLLSTHDALLALNQRDLRRTVGLLGQLAVQVAAAWRRSGSGSPHDLLASHSAAPEEVIAVLTAPAEATAGAGGPEAATPGLLPEQAASVAALLERQRATLEELSDAADVLRFWGRRSEKAAAGSAATEGREGDVPPMLTQVRRTRVVGSATHVGCGSLTLRTAAWRAAARLARPCFSHPWPAPGQILLCSPRQRRRSRCCGLPARPTTRSRWLQTCARGSWCASATSPPTCRRCRLVAGGHATASQA